MKKNKLHKIFVKMGLMIITLAISIIAFSCEKENNEDENGPIAPMYGVQQVVIDENE